jgi:hypothetical protein
MSWLNKPQYFGHVAHLLPSEPRGAPDFMCETPELRNRLHVEGCFSLYLFLPALVDLIGGVMQAQLAKAGARYITHSPCVCFRRRAFASDGIVGTA